MKYVAEIPFEIGSKIWQAKYGQRHYEYTCTVCKGTGMLTNCDNETVKCPECYGHKTKGATAQDWHPEEKTIHDVTVRFLSNGKCIITSVAFVSDRTDDEEWGVEDETGNIEELFYTKEDCVNRCEQFNVKHKDYCF